MPDSTGDSEESFDVQLKFFQKKREQLFAMIQKTYDLSNNVSPGSISRFLVRCTELSSIRDQMEIVQDRILKLNLQMPAEKADTKIDAINSSVDDLYYSIRTIETDLRGKLQTQIPTPLPAPKAEVRLPKIDVPTWSGDLLEFKNFWSMFNSMVHDSKLSDVLKLTYLRKALQGAPLALIQNLDLSDENYAAAYSLIKQRYGNVRGLAACYVNKILDFPQLSTSSAKDLQVFFDTFKTTHTAFRNLQIGSHNDFIILQCALRALPVHLRMLFERQVISETDIPTFDNLMTFIEDQLKIDELTKRPSRTPSFSKPSPPIKPTSTRPFRSSHALLVTPESTKAAVCPVCDKHCRTLYFCQHFCKLPLDEKYVKLRELRRCFRCLGSHHRDQCGSTGRCKKCNSDRHHTTLHSNAVALSSYPSLGQKDSGLKPSNGKVSSSDANHSLKSPAVPITRMVSETQSLFAESKPAPPAPRTVLLATVQALVLNNWGRLEPVRLVIDSGSQISLISRECCQRLALPCVAKVTHISGASAHRIGSSKSVVTCKVFSRLPNAPSLSTEAVVVNKVCADLPSVPIPEDVFNRLSHLNLADRVFHEPGKIDMLLGASLVPDIFPDKPTIIPGEPAALKTIFGFVIMGKVPLITQYPPAEVSLFVGEADVDRTLRRFWETEDVPNAGVVDPMHAYAEEHFVSTHSRRADGSYQVRLPFKPGLEPCFVDSLSIACRRWCNLEKRLNRNDQLKVLYDNFLEEYEVLGHMTPTHEPGSYYIPHFGILRDSPTSPLRVVFDGSCKDGRGLSLNDCLLTGPPLQKDIAEVVTVFRMHPYAITTDAKMMYRKIWLHPDDTKFQHIVWRKSPNAPLKTYALQTCTYGLSFAPFAAQRVLIQLVKDHGQDYPLASQVILTSCYMDDICCSVATMQQAHQLKRELITLMEAGSFELRKWASNAPDILADIPKEFQTTSLSWVSPETTSLHVLGMVWDPNQDVFSFSVKPLDMATTKRQVSSQIGSLFDPLGWISPVVFRAKLFLREVWECSLDWDAPLPPHIQSRWAAFSSQLPSLSKIKFSRLLLDPSLPEVQLIGFCDASNFGFAATLYLRCASADEQSVSATLLRSKTKVAPLKVLTIPRLELNGALLLSNLLKSVQPLLKSLHVQKTYLFTDSTVVLAWLQTPPHHLQTYVANRVVAILDHTELGQWFHVESSSNPADVPSRGLFPEEIIQHPVWWSGPRFLYNPISSWQIENEVTVEVVPELKKEVQTLLTFPQRCDEPFPLVVEFIKSHSSLNRLKRVLSWILRFIHNCRLKGPQKLNLRRRGPLQPEELRSSMLLCVQATQQFYLKSEITAIERGKNLRPPVARLTPFMKDGLLRVGGRLSHSELSFGAKHPYLLPKQAHLSRLICEAFHRRLMHGGPQVCQAAIRQKFWILSLRGLLRQILHKCLVCLRFNVKPNHPRMADLPSVRVRPSRAFTQTAIDMAGPLTVKATNLRNTAKLKAYICIFVCMATKAVHIELASDMTTECFIGTLTRFISRRGLCSDIYCDNGTNFTGARNEEKAIADFLCSSHPQIADHLATLEIHYHFNPPEAPWMGGLWEAAVKSTKRHLRDLGNYLFTYEEMATILAKIEAILNSRPLCPGGDSPDAIFLTPGHFLTGGPLLSPLENDLATVPTNHLSRWQAVQQASQRFWKLWSTNYLQTLMERQKWTTQTPPLKVGDVVIMLRSQTRPLDWPLGQITSLQEGNDGIARSACVKTAQGIFQRPVAKLVRLPLINDEA